MAVMTDFMKKTASIAENYSDFLVRFRSAFYPVVNEMKYMEQRTRQKQKRMLYDSDDEKIDFNMPDRSRAEKDSSGMAYGTNYVFSTVRTASDTGRGTGFGSTDNSAERKECVSGIRTGKVRLLMRL